MYKFIYIYTYYKRMRIYLDFHVIDIPWNKSPQSIHHHFELVRDFMIQIRKKYLNNHYKYRSSFYFDGLQNQEKTVSKSRSHINTLALHQLAQLTIYFRIIQLHISEDFLSLYLPSTICKPCQVSASLLDGPEPISIPKSCSQNSSEAILPP